MDNQKGEPPLSFLLYGYLLVGNRTILRDLPISAVDGVFTSSFVPVGAFLNALPLSNRAIKCNTDQCATIHKSIAADV